MRSGEDLQAEKAGADFRASVLCTKAAGWTDRTQSPAFNKKGALRVITNETQKTFICLEQALIQSLTYRQFLA